MKKNLLKDRKKSVAVTASSLNTTLTSRVAYVWRGVWWILTKIELRNKISVKKVKALQGANYKKSRLSYDVIITYDYRKLLSHRKIILRFFCN